MGSRITRVMGFLPANFQLAASFHSQLSVRHGTDRRTDNGHQCFMPHPMGAGGITRPPPQQTARCTAQDAILHKTVKPIFVTGLDLGVAEL